MHGQAIQLGAQGTRAGRLATHAPITMAPPMIGAVCRLSGPSEKISSTTIVTSAIMTAPITKRAGRDWLSSHVRKVFIFYSDELWAQVGCGRAGFQPPVLKLQ